MDQQLRAKILRTSYNDILETVVLNGSPHPAGGIVRELVRQFLANTRPADHDARIDEAVALYYEQPIAAFDDDTLEAARKAFRLAVARLVN